MSARNNDGRIRMPRGIPDADALRAWSIRGDQIYHPDDLAQGVRRLADDLAAATRRAETAEAALRSVWDECEEFMYFEPVRQQVKDALGIREFTAERTDTGSET